jgi:hypothetical protein
MLSQICRTTLPRPIWQGVQFTPPKQQTTGRVIMQKTELYDDEVLEYVNTLVDENGVYIPDEEETLPQLSPAFNKRVAKTRAKNRLARKSRKKNRRKK